MVSTADPVETLLQLAKSPVTVIFYVGAFWQYGVDTVVTATTMMAGATLTAYVLVHFKAEVKRTCWVIGRMLALITRFILTQTVGRAYTRWQSAETDTESTT